MLKKLKIELIRLVNSLFIRKGVSIGYQKHNVLNTYNENPPVKYVNKYFSKLHHFINYVPVGWNKPFVVEFEHILFMSGHSRDYTKMIESVKNSKKLLESDLCKAIIVWSDGTIREMEKYIDISAIKHKIHLVRPASETINCNRTKNKEIFTVLNIGNKFWVKGTFIAIEAFKIFHQKYKQSTFNIICNDIPNDFIMPEGIVIDNTPMLPIDKKFELFANSDVFLFPCLHDSYGVYIETLAYKLPMVSSSIYDKDEIIIDDKCGYLINSPFSLYENNIGIDYKNYEEFVALIKQKYAEDEFDGMIQDIAAKLEYLYLNRNVLEGMGENCHNHLKDKFSLDKRNEKLKNMYNQILKDI